MSTTRTTSTTPAAATVKPYGFNRIGDVFKPRWIGRHGLWCQSLTIYFSIPSQAVRYARRQWITEGSKQTPEVSHV